MRIIHDIHSFELPDEKSVLTLGVFDGLHKGHLSLLKRLDHISRKGYKKVLVTYHPHPDQVLGKSAGGRTELFTYEEKLGLLQKYRLDYCIFLPFTTELAAMSAEDYLRKILIQKLKAKHIIIGYDQTFGHRRTGDFGFLESRKPVYSYDLEQIQEVRFKKEIVSSSLIRRLISEGNIKEANRYLGHDFFLTGTVIRGNQRGRKIGFPTANLDVASTKVLPADGVYKGYCKIAGKYYRMMLNIGRNPTFSLDFLSIEAHILDWKDSLYGETLRVFLTDRIRDEKKFSGPEELSEQIKKDAKSARKVNLLFIKPGV